MFEWTFKGKPKKGYRVIEGKTNFVIDMLIKDGRKAKKKFLKIQVGDVPATLCSNELLKLLLVINLKLL